MDPLSLFLVQALVVIATSRALGLLARRIQQPMVIAEIVAGIVLGPSLLGFLWPEGLEILFPASSMGALGLLSQVGLILFMLLVGLEFDPQMLRGRGRASVLISHTSIVVPFVLGLALAVYLHPKLSPDGVSFTSAALFMGIAMSITAFPVLARILVERQLLRSKVGAVTITCAAVDDVTAWCLLAFVVSTVRSTGLVEASITTALAIGYISFMLVVVRPFLGRLSQTSVTAEGLTQNVVAGLVLLVLLSAELTERIGIHALFGAFVLGAVIPKERGFAQALAAKLEDLVVVFLLPLFFAYSGLRTEIGLLDSGDAWWMCGLIILVACVGKFGGSFLAARWTGLAWREAGALGILMNTRGLMELVVLNIGLDLGVISPKLFTMMVLMALFTTFITTPLLQLVYPPRELAKSLVDEQQPQPPARVLSGLSAMLCVAHREAGPPLVDLARGFTSPYDVVFALHLKRPAERTSSYAPAPEGGADRRGDNLIGAVSRASELGLRIKPLSFVSANPGRDICNVAEVKDVDLVVLGWHKPLFSRSVLGGTVFEVLDHAQSHVAVLIDRGLEKVRRVLVPYCGSVHDSLALALAARFARVAGASITILHVVTDRESKLGAGAATVEAFGDAIGPAIDLKIVHHHRPADAAIAESKAGYDLVVVGVGRQWGLPIRHYGILPEEFVAESTTSLLIVSKSPTRTVPFPDERGINMDETSGSEADVRSRAGGA